MSNYLSFKKRGNGDMHVMVAVLCSWAGCFDVTALLSTEENKELWVTCWKKLQKKNAENAGVTCNTLKYPFRCGSDCNRSDHRDQSCYFNC